MTRGAPRGWPAAPGGAPLRVLFALPGLHRVVRGAEVAFEAVARHLARVPGFDVTLIGSGLPRAGEPYRFLHAGCIPRERFERWPRGPLLRSDCVYEELTFVPGLLRAYRPQDFDVTVACSYPFTNWFLRGRTPRPAHVYVTQNGDWPAQRPNSEYRLFSCDGLVCTNPEFYERNRRQWRCVLIPNGVDPDVYAPGPAERAAFGLPQDAPVVLMVSALIPSKRVLEAISAVAPLPDVTLVVAGDGPLRDQVDRAGRELLNGRFHRITLERGRMPALYRAADVFLHMSLIEPSANAYIEALATGLPIVTHDRDVTRWTFADAAFLVDATNPEQVTGGLRRALCSTTAAARDGRREVVLRRFTWSAIAREYAEFLRAVVQSTRVRPRRAPRASVDAEGDVPKPAMQGCAAEPASPTTDVGVVAIGRNEGERLRLCLESVIAQCPLVVYVDSGSTDGSVALARQLGMHVVELDARQPCTAARGRQAGLDFLRSVAPRLEFVQFLDGDCVLRPGWVESAAAFLRQRRDVAAVCGRRREVHAERSSYSRLVDVDWDIPPGEVPYFGGDVLCSVSAIDAAGGWSTDLIAGEEPELCFRLRDRGKRIWRLAREATEHDVAMSRFGEYWRRAVRSGFAYAEVGWRHRHGLGRAWLMRALTTVVYGLIMPLLILLAAFACPLLIVVPVLLYARAAAAMTGACLRKGCMLKLSLTYAGANLVCKLAGTLGVLRWALRQATGGRQHIIEYKRAATGIRSALATGPKAAH